MWGACSSAAFRDNQWASTMSIPAKAGNLLFQKLKLLKHPCSLPAYQDGVSLQDLALDDLDPISIKTLVSLTHLAIHLAPDSTLGRSLVYLKTAPFLQGLHYCLLSVYTRVWLWATKGPSFPAGSLLQGTETVCRYPGVHLCWSGRISTSSASGKRSVPVADWVGIVGGGGRVSWGQCQGCFLSWETVLRLSRWECGSDGSEAETPHWDLLGQGHPGVDQDPRVWAQGPQIFFYFFLIKVHVASGPWSRIQPGGGGLVTTTQGCTSVREPGHNNEKEGIRLWSNILDFVSWANPEGA